MGGVAELASAAAVDKHRSANAPVTRQPASQPSCLIALIKPQFEAGRRDVARGAGVIRDPAIQRQVVLEVLTSAGENRLGVLGLIRSPLIGPKGNAEFLVLLQPGAAQSDLGALLDSVFT
jgi:23S rRNA (cytidine1920-2'-O)/16S rRNA (cytidine1409-2'-O)-methyltransferase